MLLFFTGETCVLLILSTMSNVWHHWRVQSYVTSFSRALICKPFSLNSTN